MILKIFLPKNLVKILVFFAQTTASFCKNCDHNIVFLENTNFFRRKLAKIAEKCDVTSTRENNYVVVSFTA
jgi:hypothetical protein